MNSRYLQFYITTETPCSYFVSRKSINLVPDPGIPMNMPIYNQLIQHGFRRSGRHCYRPHCQDCHACIACRIPVNAFTMNRSQQRCLNSNKDLDLSVVDAGFNEEYFDLYGRYLNSRHGDGSMANPTKEDFKQFLYCDWSDTRFLELRLNGQLVAVAVSDIVSNGVSAVYSFYDPELTGRGLGNFCILKQIDYAKELQLKYLYLGYWVENHEKMHYKSKFKPLQLYLNDKWQTHQGQNKT